MKMTIAATLLALCFATGFTCSKQTPEAEQAAPPATQEQMAVPPEGQPATPPPGEMAPPAEAAPAAPPAGH